MISQLINIVTQAAVRKRQQRYLDSVILGPDTTFRSELIDAMAAHG